MTTYYVAATSPEGTQTLALGPFMGARAAWRAREWTHQVQLIGEAVGLEGYTYEAVESESTEPGVLNEHIYGEAAAA